MLVNDIQVKQSFLVDSSKNNDNARVLVCFSYKQVLEVEQGAVTTKVAVMPLSTWGVSVHGPQII